MRVGGPDCQQALLTLHGGPGLSHEPLRALDALASGDRCVIYFDQRGVGGSSAPEGPWTALDLAADIEAVRAAWGLRKVDVLGHSWGAYLAALYAAEHSGHVRALIYSSPAPLSPSGWDAFARAMRERIALLRTSGQIPAPVEMHGDDCGPSTAVLSPAYLFDPNHPVHERNADCSHDCYRRSWNALPTATLASVAESSRKRGTVIQGAGEVLGSQIVDEWTQLHAGKLDIHVIERCGHLLHSECPEAWIREVRAALD